MSERRCMACGSAMIVRTESYRYAECGLPNVRLEGVHVWRCSSCDEFELVLPHLRDLHETIAEAIAKKDTGLTAAEVKFLRKHVGWGKDDMAAEFNVADDAVIAWESGTTRIPEIFDRKLRDAALTKKVVSYSGESAKPLRTPIAVSMIISEKDDRWEPKSNHAAELPRLHPQSSRGKHNPRRRGLLDAQLGEALGKWAARGKRIGAKVTFACELEQHIARVRVGKRKSMRINVRVAHIVFQKRCV